MRKLALLLSVLTLLILPACQLSFSEWMFDQTGEEELLSQVRGMALLATNVLHPQPQTADLTLIPHTGVNPFGINVFLNEEVEEVKRERSVEMIAEAGFHWLRQEFPWEDIEIHGKGDFEDRRHEPHRSAWEKYDHIVDLAGQYGLEIVPRLSNPPAWTRVLTDTIGPYAPPDDLADWGDYVHAVVSRYRGRVGYYQLWNEPNIYPEWGERPVDPEGYTRLLCEGYRRAKEADPDAVIVSGALAPTVSLDPGPGPGLGLRDFVFLQRMYDAGASACFDVMAVNNYMLWSGPTDRRMQPLNVNFARPIYIRDLMVANGDAHKAIWISEMNANAVPNDPNIHGVGVYGQVTLEQQARYAPRAYQRAIEEWPWMGVVNFWFFKRASDAERDQSWYYFRMVEPDFTPMPVYESMREYTTNLEPALHAGVHQEDHWALDYRGEWETVESEDAILGAYHVATQPGSALRFAFDGASLALHPGPGAGEVEIQVDGQAPRRISLDGRPVWLVRGLREMRREATLTVVSGEVGIDMLLVHRSALRSALANGRALVYLALGLVCVGVLIRIFRRQ
ncbi:MAG TPA: hypothetical protein ENN19_10510 [Chloroflexi bacterium]|nr:hypothetical protein [Chloroflexota bacterium]